MHQGVLTWGSALSRNYLAKCALECEILNMITAVDIHNGFNKIDHSNTITILSDMEVAGALPRPHQASPPPRPQYNVR